MTGIGDNVVELKKLKIKKNVLKLRRVGSLDFGRKVLQLISWLETRVYM